MIYDYIIQLNPKQFGHGQINVMTYIPYMQKTCDVAEKAILAKKNLPKKCVNHDKM